MLSSAASAVGVPAIGPLLNAATGSRRPERGFTLSFKASCISLLPFVVFSS